jgi:hypothetical protein
MRSLSSSAPGLIDAAGGETSSSTVSLHLERLFERAV